MGSFKVSLEHSVVIDRGFRVSGRVLLDGLL